jgi:hypothetical protein
MRELAEIIITYVSIAAGFLTFWLSLYWGNSLMGSLERGLIAGGGFFIFGFVVRFGALAIVLMGDGPGAAEAADGAVEAAEESGLE